MNDFVTSGKAAFLRTSDEPVFVLEINGEDAVVRRPVNTPNGVVHVVDSFPVRELCTAKDRILEELELSKFTYELREKEARKRQSEEQKFYKADSAVPETLLN